MEIKRGGLEPPIVIDISGAAGDLNGVVSWRLVAERANDVAVFTDTAPTVEIDTGDPTKAVVTHTWVAGETDTVGRILVETEAIWPGNRPQPFPTVAVEVTPDLG